MSTVLSLPEKRHDLGLGPEQPPEKRPKLYDIHSGEGVDNTIEMEMESDRDSEELFVSATERDSNSEEANSSEEAKSVDSNLSVGSSSPHTRRVVIPPYCEICHGHVGHRCWDCPDRSRGMGFCCPYCYGPCKKKDGDDDDGLQHRSIELVKHCVECGYMGDHWVDDCPFRREPEVDESLTSDDDEVWL